MKDIKNYEGLYSVTSCGKVWSHRNKKLLTPNAVRKNYYVVQLCKNGGRKSKFIHRLVAQAFIENPENKETVNHKNGKHGKFDNYVNNLEWNTVKENIHHAINTGLRKNGRGETNNLAKLNFGQVIVIKKLLEKGNMKHYEIADFFNVCRTCVSAINQGQNWKHELERIDIGE